MKNTKETTKTKPLSENKPLSGSKTNTNSKPTSGKKPNNIEIISENKNFRIEKRLVGKDKKGKPIYEDIEVPLTPKIKESISIMIF